MNAALIVAGESSGDIHAARLVKAMKSLKPELKFFGVGGEQMKAQGVELISHIDGISIMGFIEVLGRLPKMKRLLNNLLEEIRRREAKLAVLVDYPGFNLRLAQALKKRSPAYDIKVFYYISPQVWAWGERRIPRIARIVDRMAGILPFETKTYQDSGLDFHFVGHPLMEEMTDYISRDEFIARHKLKGERPIVALLPGSRPQEVLRMLPLMLKAAKLIAEKLDCSFALGASSAIKKQLFENLGGVTLVRNDTHSLMKHSDLVIVASGTATLETAIAGTPMVVVYRTNLINYIIGKRLVKLDNIALANLVAGESVAPELIQGEASPARIAAIALQILTEPNVAEVQREKLRGVKEKLGESGASLRAAKLALELMG